MVTFIIGIGGSGAKIVESIIHCASVGIYPTSSLKIIFVDPDESNGNLGRAKDTTVVYKRCFEYINESKKGSRKFCSWMSTKIDLLKPEIWTPLNNEQNNSLSYLYNYGNYQADNPLKNLFDVIYSENEKETFLTEGFRGRPSIGSAVMSRLDLGDQYLNTEPWASMFNEIENVIGGEGGRVRIFLCGSAFGGTGASGFPTIGRMIANRVKKSDYRESVSIGGALLLPYFNFRVPSNIKNSSELYAKPEHFLLNTEAALNFYEKEAKETFDSIYLLGNNTLSTVEEFSLGRDSQKNEPHFVELYAALALEHFLSRNEYEKGEAILISRKNAEEINWDDLPGRENRSKLKSAIRFSCTWSTDISKSLAYARNNGFEKFSRISPWSLRYFDFPNEKVKKGRRVLFDIDIDNQILIDNWCFSFLNWLRYIHVSSGDRTRVNLISLNELQKVNSYDEKSEISFENLIVGGRVLDLSQYSLRRSLDEPKIDEPNKGLAGLARVLFSICQ